MLTHAQRAYDAWVTREPDWGEPPTPPHCTDCGGFLTIGPERVESWEDIEQCTGISEAELADKDNPKGMYGAECYNWNLHAPHTFSNHGGITEYRTCKKCGATNTWVDAS